MSINRRVFVRHGVMALLALGLPPSFLRRALLASRPQTGRKTLVCIFQRGAVDGLSMVAPFGDPFYYGERRTTAVREPVRGVETAAIDLDGFFGLHPALRPLHALYEADEMAIVHATGSPHPTRSHFEAQAFMETGAPGDPATEDGWLNRVLAHSDCQCDGRTLADGAAHAADHAAGQAGMAAGRAALRGVTIGTTLPVALRGRHPALAIADVERYGLGGEESGLESIFSRLYRSDEGDAVAEAGGGAFEAMRILREADPSRYRPRDGIDYPRSEFGQSLRQIAQLIKSGVGIEIAFAEIGGWDTHASQGAGRGRLANRLRELALGMRAFHDDLGDQMEDVVVLTMSEFGRTVAENGSGGTDHGHATAMFVLGGEVAGGQVYGDWPGLAPEQRYQGRDLAVTTDFRDIFAEIADRHLGARDLDRVFAGHAVDPARYRGFLG